MLIYYLHVCLSNHCYNLRFWGQAHMNQSMPCMTLAAKKFSYQAYNESLPVPSQLQLPVGASSSTYLIAKMNQPIREQYLQTQ